METDELIAKLHELLDESEDRRRPIRATATINRGMCAGSVTYDTKPVYTRREAEVVRTVREAYAARGLRINMETDKGVSTFFRVFMEACRNVCSENGRVSIGGLLVFEAEVYASLRDRARGWMNAKMVNSDFNALPNKVRLDISRKLLECEKAKAKAKPFGKKSEGSERVGRVTTITCPECGTQITIEDTEKK